MTDQELLNRQQTLQARAHQVLGELNLLEHLRQYGEVSIVGSLKLGLMAWPDIDIETYIKNYSLDDTLQIAKRFLEHRNAVDITIRDYRLDTNPNKPKGLYIVGKYNLNEERWKLDLWLLQPEHKQSFDITDKMLDLTTQQRLAILRIKNSMWDHPQYRKGFASVDIYTAVLNHNVTTVDGFKSYLSQVGKQL